MSRTQLTRRLLSAWNIARTSPRTDKTIDEALNFIDLQMTRTATKTFYWMTDPEKHPVNFRIPDKTDPRTRRDIDDIPTEEIAACVRYIVGQQYSLLPDDLQREVAKLFGFSRCPVSMQAPINEGIHYAAEHGWVMEKNGRVTVR